MHIKYALWTLLIVLLFRFIDFFLLRLLALKKHKPYIIYFIPPYSPRSSRAVRRYSRHSPLPRQSEPRAHPCRHRRDDDNRYRRNHPRTDRRNQQDRQKRNVASLAVAVGGHGQYFVAVVYGGKRNECRAAGDIHSLNAHSRSAHGEQPEMTSENTAE